MNCPASAISLLYPPIRYAHIATGGPPETSEQSRSSNELIRRCSSLPQPVASQIRRASRGKMKRVLCAAVFSCASIERRYPAIDGKQSLKIDALSFAVVAAEQSGKPGPRSLGISSTVARLSIPFRIGGDDGCGAWAS